MKVLLSIILFLLSAQSHTQTGRACFLDQFDANATGLNKTNAYLIAYLNAMIYPGEGFRFLYGIPYPKSDSKKIKDLERNNAAFKNDYEARLKYLFEKSSIQLPGQSKGEKPLGATFDFQSHCNEFGYDPEAMIISTDDFVQVIFRGTDRNSCASSGLGYEFSEWTKTNFDFGLIQPSKFSGKVHQGFWKSLNDGEFAYTLAKKLIDVYGATKKKLWISGHSLGGAHAQLFALYLKLEHQVNVQGLYLYASPHPGDAAFANQLNTAIGKTNIQRFEFADDPIPVLPPSLPPFNAARAGIRNYFKDVNTPVFNSEQVIGWDDSKAVCALNSVGANGLMHIDVFNCPGGVCYHHPTWYLKACRNLLPASQYDRLPPDVPTPDLLDAGCTPLTLCIGNNNNYTACLLSLANNELNSRLDEAGDAIEAIAWNASNYWDNITGDAVEEGRYRLVCYKFSKKEKRYLTRKTLVSVTGVGNTQLNFDHDNMFLDKKRYDGKQVFKIKKDGPNYIITNPDNENSVVEIEDAAKVNTEGADVDMGNKAVADVIGNQHWWFFKIVSGTEKIVYVLKNMSVPGKVMDAADACNTGNDCSVNVFKAISNDLSQIWLLEKVN